MISGSDYIKAAGAGNLNVINTYLSQGSDINYKENNTNALFEAAKNGRSAVIELLVKKGMSVDIENEDKWTPLFAATTCGQYQTAVLLITLGANTHASSYEGFTPISIARNHEQAELALALQALIQTKPVMPTAQPALTVDSAAPQVLGHDYIIAAGNGDLATIKKYIAQGGNLHYKEDEMERTLYFFQSITRKNVNALHEAVTNGHIEVVRHLLQAGMFVNVQSPASWTPLHAAAKGNRRDIAKLLVEFGANTHAANDEGFSPVAIAKMSEYFELADDLETMVLLITKDKLRAEVVAGASPLQLTVTPAYQAAREKVRKAREERAEARCHPDTKRASRKEL